jgi:type I restriction enzyme, R subunit
LIAKYTQSKPSKQTMTREQLINLLSSSANLMEERDDIVAYINCLQAGKSLTEPEIREGYQTFKTEKYAKEIAATAQKHGLETTALQTFVDDILRRMIFDGEKLSDLLAPLDLGWKERTKKELALMENLVPLLKKLA